MHNIAETIRSLAGFGLFFKAAASTGLIRHLNSQGPWTLFLPTDSAFEQLPPRLLKQLFRKPGNQLSLIIGYHIIPGNVPFSSLIHKKKLETLFGLQLVVAVTEETEIILEDARILRIDNICRNGIIHIIDSVLIPKINLAEFSDEKRLPVY